MGVFGGQGIKSRNFHPEHHPALRISIGFYMEAYPEETDRKIGGLGRCCHPDQGQISLRGAWTDANTSLWSLDLVGRVPTNSEKDITGALLAAEPRCNPTFSTTTRWNA